MNNYYEILGIEKNASQQDIKRAYRKLAMQHHPDRGGDEEYFQQIQTAYDVLGDPEKKSQYDNPRGFYSQQQNFDDILDQYFTQFDLRSQMRRSRISMQLSLEDVARGGPRIIQLDNKSGVFPVEITVPQGIEDGEVVRYPRLMPNNTDLVIEFRVKPHPEWQRQGLDLWCEKQLNFWQLITGTETTVTDLLGTSYNLKVPKKTDPASTLRLKGKGLQRNGLQAGDIYVKISATMPDHIPESIVDILNNLTKNK